MNCDACEPLINPYLDAELQMTEALAVERHLADCPTCRRQYEALEKLRAEIAAAELDYRPPARLARRIKGRQWNWALAAAAAVVLAIGAPVVWQQRTGDDRELLDGHLRSLAAAHLVDVPSSDRHTVKPWFQGKVPFSPPVPDLTQDGFPMVGGRLEVIRERRTAALVYKRREHVINVFIADALPSGRRSGRQGYNVNCWNARGLAYCAVSDLNAAELAEFTRLFTSRTE